ncbi:MAG TPA: nuclear transport factor 2 family protein [Chitinophagaceae bacterium]|nr:nuclear transport factor 2 family protein [Chitinophagaceae bacterium]
MKKLLLGVFLSAFLFACNDEKAESTGTTDAATTTETKTGDELLALSDGDGVKSAMAAFSKGDVDGMTSNYDDNVRYLWSGGDSLIGKKAVQDYYNGRWKLIDSLDISDHIVLPVKVNVQQSPYHTLGKWVLHWGFVHVKYKNGKKLNFWIHNDYHYNDAGKVDIVIQYIDRHPLMEATKDLIK